MNPATTRTPAKPNEGDRVTIPTADGARIEGEVFSLLAMQFLVFDKNNHWWFCSYKDDWEAT